MTVLCGVPDPHSSAACSFKAGHTGRHTAFFEGALTTWGEPEPAPVEPAPFVENAPSEIVSDEDNQVMMARRFLEGAHDVLKNRGYSEGEIAVVNKIEQDITKAGRFFWDLLASMAEDAPTKR
jgi:hypothetical protein